MQTWWQQVVSEYELDNHHLHLLRLGCESYDRCQQARQQLINEGTTFKDKNGNLRAHPAIAIERDAKTSFVRIVRELGLDAPSNQPTNAYERMRLGVA
jgi:P27 family predicted phage terminase small subunit